MIFYLIERRSWKVLILLQESSYLIRNEPVDFARVLKLFLKLFEMLIILKIIIKLIITITMLFRIYDCQWFLLLIFFIVLIHQDRNTLKTFLSLCSQNLGLINFFGFCYRLSRFFLSKELSFCFLLFFLVFYGFFHSI
jgi:hypothetical protein